MNRFIHAEAAFRQRSGRKHTDGTRYLARLIGENISEDIAGEDDVELLRISHDLHCGIVHIEMIEFHLRILFRHLRNDSSPESGAV